MSSFPELFRRYQKAESGDNIDAKLILFYQAYDAYFAEHPEIGLQHKGQWIAHGGFKEIVAVGDSYSDVNKKIEELRDPETRVLPYKGKIFFVGFDNSGNNKFPLRRTNI